VHFFQSEQTAVTLFEMLHVCVMIAHTGLCPSLVIGIRILLQVFSIDGFHLPESLHEGVMMFLRNFSQHMELDTIAY